MRKKIEYKLRADREKISSPNNTRKYGMPCSELKFRSSLHWRLGQPQIKLIEWIYNLENNFHNSNENQPMNLDRQQMSRLRFTIQFEEKHMKSEIRGGIWLTDEKTTKKISQGNSLSS